MIGFLRTGRQKNTASVRYFNADNQVLLDVCTSLYTMDLQIPKTRVQYAWRGGLPRTSNKPRLSIMKDKILMVVPSRSRSHKIPLLVQSYLDTQTGYADLCIALDDDDAFNYDMSDSRIIWEVNPRMRMIPTLNFIADKYLNEYKAIGFMGDDHLPRTKGWDAEFLHKINSNYGFAVCYGNDLLQGDKMATAGVLGSELIRTLGYMVIPTLTHLFADVFWCDLGKATDTLHYFPDIVIEHMHYINGKAQKDNAYAEVNSTEMWTRDHSAYDYYKSFNFNSDIKKILDAISRVQTISNQGLS